MYCNNDPLIEHDRAEKAELIKSVRAATAFRLSRDASLPALRKAADLTLRPAPNTPAVDSQSDNPRGFRWHPASGHAPRTPRPAVELPRPIAPKVETGNGDLLRKAMRVTA